MSSSPLPGAAAGVRGVDHRHDDNPTCFRFLQNGDDFQFPAVRIAAGHPVLVLTGANVLFDLNNRSAGPTVLAADECRVPAFVRARVASTEC